MAPLPTSPSRIFLNASQASLKRNSLSPSNTERLGSKNLTNIKVSTSQWPTPSTGSALPTVTLCPRPSPPFPRPCWAQRRGTSPLDSSTLKSVQNGSAVRSPPASSRTSLQGILQPSQPSQPPPASSYGCAVSLTGTRLENMDTTLIFPCQLLRLCSVLHQDTP